MIPYTSLCTCTFPKVFVYMYVPRWSLRTYVHRYYIEDDYKPPAYLERLDRVFFLSFFLSPLSLPLSCVLSLAICEALILLYHKDIAPTIIPPFLHQPCGCGQSTTGWCRRHVYLQRVSLYYPSSLHRVTSEKRNNMRRMLESIFLSRRRCIAFVLRNTAIRESQSPSRAENLIRMRSW